MISKANQCSSGVKRLNWICQKVAQSLDPMLSRFSWSEPVRYFISSAIRLKVKLCPQPVSVGAIYRRKKRLGHLVLGSFFQFFSFSPMICEASSPLWKGTYTAFLIHWNTGFSVLKCGLDTPVLFFSQDAQNLQILISSSCQSCPDAALLGFFRRSGVEKNTVSLLPSHHRWWDTHWDNAEEWKRAHLRNHQRCTAHMPLPCHHVSSMRIQPAPPQMAWISWFCLYLFFLRRKNRLFSDYIIKLTMNPLPRLTGS